jgi:sirohydrochlorin cobaltochelatase
MQTSKLGVILVGHGGIPKDCPRDLIMRLKRLEGQRRDSGMPVSSEERELDHRIRHWPRNQQNDPYEAGLRTLASRLEPLLSGRLFTLAYNEYCTPTLEEAAADLIRQGTNDITIITTMFTPGGSHSEIEIPEILARLRQAHPNVTLRYAWPFDLDLVAGMLAEQLNQKTGCFSEAAGYNGGGSCTMR